MPPCLVGMEACIGTHHLDSWPRNTSGHIRRDKSATVAAIAVEIGGTLRLNELRPHPHRPRRRFCFLHHVLVRAFALTHT
jgi:hypothetical protein